MDFSTRSYYVHSGTSTDSSIAIGTSTTTNTGGISIGVNACGCPSDQQCWSCVSCNPHLNYSTIYIPEETNKMRMIQLVAYLPETEDQEPEVLIAPEWVMAKSSELAKIKFARKHSKVDLDKHVIKELVSYTLS